MNYKFCTLFIADRASHVPTNIIFHQRPWLRFLLAYSVVITVLSLCLGLSKSSSLPPTVQNPEGLFVTTDICVHFFVKLAYNANIFVPVIAVYHVFHEDMYNTFRINDMYNMVLCAVVSKEGWPLWVLFAQKEKVCLCLCLVV